MIKAAHFVAGRWLNSGSVFSPETIHNTNHSYPNATEEIVDLAATQAAEAFLTFGRSTAEERAILLEAIAAQIENRGPEITDIGTSETALPPARLESERGRTVGQLRMFADLLRDADYLRCTRDSALPDRQPLPRPELHSMMRPVGPVAVFGASNFPLAFSTAGGDTASALAAGCPVIVKGHPLHPGTSDIVAQAIEAALLETSNHPGTFSLIQDAGTEIPAKLVTHPAISAVAFTGSLQVGRLLFNLCAGRQSPIPFFGEMGSINPIFVLPSALENRSAQIADGWLASLTMGGGQFCTKPGVIVIPDAEETDSFVERVGDRLDGIGPQVLLSKNIASSFQSNVRKVRRTVPDICCFGEILEGREAKPIVLATDSKTWLGANALWEEIFGPFGIIVRAQDLPAMLRIAESLVGQLTATIHAESDDAIAAEKLFPILESKAGRIIGNGFPTGVEIAQTMSHGGPYPASTNSGTTSVGSLAIERFLRPVCYQSIPAAWLPIDLRTRCQMQNG